MKVRKLYKKLHFSFTYVLLWLDLMYLANHDIAAFFENNQGVKSGDSGKSDGGYMQPVSSVRTTTAAMGTDTVSVEDTLKSNRLTLDYIPSLPKG